MDPSGSRRVRVVALAALVSVCFGSVGRADADVDRAESERLRFDEAGPPGGIGPELATAPGAVSVLDVNRALGMLILNAGVRQGIRPGMGLIAVRDGRPVARVRVVDARREIAGAVIEQTESGRYPEVRDGLLMVAGSRD